MQPAVEPLRTLAQSLTTSEPDISIVSNKDGEVVSAGRDVLDRIVSQIANPVRWDLCMERLASLGVTGVIEVAPAGTLVGLIKRAVPTIEQFALKSPADIDAAREFAAAHGGI
jgi:[acyl-carrier-protein] S-malonyltransferase